MNDDHELFNPRRRFLGSMGAMGISALMTPFAAQAAEVNAIELPFANGYRPLTTAFPQKSSLILQRTRPPLLETPFHIFDQGVLTPNEYFYARWHLANIPTTIDPATFRLNIRGHVNKTISLSPRELMHKFRRVEMVAVNQCAGNSRGFFNPRVPGAEWGNGAMGNARWTGVWLKDVLDYAGIRPGALQVRFNGLETAVLPETPKFMKSLTIEHARNLGAGDNQDGDVMIAYAMNGEPLPLLNGYPLRLIVPGWFATYWIKMLNDIEVLNKPDNNFWTTKAYLAPDRPHASVRPGETGFKLVPVSRMLPRSFFTNIRDGATMRPGQSTLVRGIAFGGRNGLAKVHFSADRGRTWAEVKLAADYGKYSFRQWETTVSFPSQGTQRLMVRAMDTTGQMQPIEPNWNGSGFMRNVIETVDVQIA